MKNSRRSLIIVAMALLLAVVLAMGGVTFAKYITKTNIDTTPAKVAKWGFVLKSDAKDLFATTYKEAPENTSYNVVVKDDEAAGTIVVSSGTHELVAPGATGSMTFSIDGTAEVLSKITVDLTIKDVFVDDYHPLKWTLVWKKDNGETQAVKTRVTLAEIEEYIDAMDCEIAANNQAACDGDWTLTWEWDFYADEATDLLDTKLGALAAGTQTAAADTYSLDVSVALSITVEQVQAHATVTP